MLLATPHRALEPLHAQRVPTASTGPARRTDSADRRDRAASKRTAPVGVLQVGIRHRRNRFPFRPPRCCGEISTTSAAFAAILFAIFYVAQLRALASRPFRRRVALELSPQQLAFSTPLSRGAPWTIKNPEKVWNMRIRIAHIIRIITGGVSHK